MDGKLVYDEGSYSGGPGKKGAVKGPFFDFPADLILSLPCSSDSEGGEEAEEGEEARERERDRKALLSHCGCVEAQEFFVEIGKKLLGGEFLQLTWTVPMTYRREKKLTVEFFFLSRYHHEN